jgi:hypothetical protein
MSINIKKINYSIFLNLGIFNLNTMENNISEINQQNTNILDMEICSEENIKEFNRIKISLKKLTNIIGDQEEFLQLTKLYKNIYLFIINKIINPNLHKEHLSNLVYKSFFLKNILKLRENKFIIDFDFSENLKKIINNIQFKNKDIWDEYQGKDRKMIFTWEFNEEDLFSELNVNLSEKMKLYIINNNGGGNIPITNNGIIYNTAGNCQTHIIINIIWALIKEIKNNKNLSEKNQNILNKFIISNLINTIKNIDNNEIYTKSKNQDLNNLILKFNFPDFDKELDQLIIEKINTFDDRDDYIENRLKEFFGIYKQYAWSNNVKIKESTFDNKIEENEEKILSSEENLVDFLSKFYEIMVLNFVGNYSFQKNKEKIFVNRFITNRFFLANYYAFILGLKNIEFIEKITFSSKGFFINNNYNFQYNNIFSSNIYHIPEHSQNIIYTSEKNLENYIKSLELMNGRFKDINNKVTEKTFYYEHKVFEKK